MCREKQRRVDASAMKKVLLLGAGYVSAPVVEYLTSQGLAVTVGMSSGCSKNLLILISAW